LQHPRFELQTATHHLPGLDQCVHALKDAYNSNLG
jgi:hypothetical protein